MMTTISPRKMALGLSLVELMVAITISSVLLLGVSSVYISSRRSNAIQDEFSRLQENGRFAIHTLSKDIRQAGYLGCANLRNITPNIIATDPTNNNKDPLPASFIGFTQSNYIIGHDCGSGSCTPAVPAGSGATPVDGTTAITIRRASSCNSSLTGNMGVRNANLQIAGNNAANCNFQAGETLMISDCAAADIFNAVNVNNGTNTVIATSSAGNTGNFLSKVYDQTAQVMRYERVTYYIGTNTRGGRSLYSVIYDPNNAPNPVELVENADDMQITFGLDTNNNGSANGFYQATAVQNNNLWGSVISVRLQLLMATRDNLAHLNNNQKSTPYMFQGQSQNSTDLRYRREFTNTINIRNMTPTSD